MTGETPAVIEYRLLGPLTVRIDQRSVALDGLRLRALLARLLLDADRVVSADRLIDDVWNGRGSRKGLQVAIGRLRVALNCRATGDVLTTQGTGYGIELRNGDRFDVRSFETDLARARELLPADPERASALLERAIDGWRGAALGDLADFDWAVAEAHRLEELRSDAHELRRDAQLALGAGAELVAELQALVSVAPQRERSWEQLMRALYRAGRQLDALRTYHQVRSYLVEEHGVEPGESLRKLHQAILMQDPTLAPRPRHLDRIRGHRLPLPLTTFIGREAECADLQSLLVAERLVTLIGVGGAGKSRLAIAVAEKTTAVEQVFFVDLTLVGDNDRVEDALLASLGLTAPSRRHALDLVKELLAPESVLLVLDNCEHVRMQTTSIAAALLEGCQDLRILATSRVRLGVPGESVWPVPPMSVDAAHPYDSDAVRLFVDRARKVQPDFSLDDRGVELAIDICCGLDGLPLAIELSAARLRIMSLAEISSALEDQLSLLGGGPPATTARQQTLRASIAWSEALLEEPARKLLHRLGVFSGGATLDQTRSVCCDEDVRTQDLYDLLVALVDNSLVVIDDRTDTTRYRLPEPIRQYAIETLDRSGELSQWRQRHLNTFASRLEELDRYDSLITAGGADVYDAEYPNLVAALQEALAQHSVTALRMASMLTDYWIERGRITEGVRLTEQALAVNSPRRSAGRSVALSCLSALCIHEGDMDRAQTLGQEALDMSAPFADPEAKALARMRVGLLTGLRAPWRGLPLIEEAIALMKDRPGRVLSFARQCHLELTAQTDDWSQIEPSLTGTLELARRLGHETVLGWCSVQLAQRAEASADLPAVRRHAEYLISSQEDPLVRAAGTAALARCLVLEGCAGQARQLLVEEIDRLRPGQGTAMSVLLTSLGGAEFALGHMQAARAALSTPTISVSWASYSGHLLRLRLAVFDGRPREGADVARRLRARGERLGSRRARALAELALAATALVEGDTAMALEIGVPSLHCLAEGGFVLHVLDGLELAAAAVSSDDPALATCLLAAVAAERARRGIACPPDGAWSVPGQLTARLEGLLDADGYGEQWAVGSDWSLEDAMARCRPRPE